MDQIVQWENLEWSQESDRNGIPYHDCNLTEYFEDEVAAAWVNVDVRIYPNSVVVAWEIDVYGDPGEFGRGGDADYLVPSYITPKHMLKFSRDDWEHNKDYHMKKLLETLREEAQQA